MGNHTGPSVDGSFAGRAKMQTDPDKSKTFQVRCETYRMPNSQIRTSTLTFILQNNGDVSFFGKLDSSVNDIYNMRLSPRAGRVIPKSITKYERIPASLGDTELPTATWEVQWEDNSPEDTIETKDLLVIFLTKIEKHYNKLGSLQIDFDKVHEATFTLTGPADADDGGVYTFNGSYAESPSKKSKQQ